VRLGIDVGGTKVLGVAVDAGGGITAEQRRETVAGGVGLLDDLADLARTLLADGQREAGEPSAKITLGVGVPGLVDRSGTLLFAPNLSGASGTAIKEGLEERLGPGVVVYADNDATCAAAGECAFGAGKGRRDVLFVTLGTGIGGGVLCDGRLLRGAINFAGEIGHMVVDPQGPPCGCGRRGCWERYASGSGLGRLARDAALAGRAARVMALAGGDADAVRGEQVVRAAGEGDQQAHDILAEFAWWLSLGLANLANILDPEVIVIGGGLVRAGEALLEPTRRAFYDQLEGSSARPGIDIVPALLGDRGGAVGAAVVGGLGVDGGLGSNEGGSRPAGL
jgi:glucokinase